MGEFLQRFFLSYVHNKKEGSMTELKGVLL